jgi:hypothetical protein
MYKPLRHPFGSLRSNSAAGYTSPSGDLILAGLPIECDLHFDAHVACTNLAIYSIQIRRMVCMVRKISIGASLLLLVLLVAATNARTRALPMKFISVSSVGDFGERQISA